MKYYVITDFNHFKSEQWLSNEDIKQLKETNEDFEVLTKEEFEEQTRICSECGRITKKGYCVEQGLQYFCSDSCLYQNYTKEEFEEMYNDGEGDSFYTEWGC